jgi:hypothetical protein
MPHLREIEVDWDIFKMIETERRSFDEPHYIALRRILKLPELDSAMTSVPAQGAPWREDGVEVPHGSAARMEYQRGSQVYEGSFLNGRLVVSGKAYDTLSAAASDLAKTKSGSKTSLNGWLYWKAKFPGEEYWRSLEEMRKSIHKL